MQLCRGCKPYRFSIDYSQQTAPKIQWTYNYLVNPMSMAWNVLWRIYSATILQRTQWWQERGKTEKCVSLNSVDAPDLDSLSRRGTFLSSSPETLLGQEAVRLVRFINIKSRWLLLQSNFLYVPWMAAVFWLSSLKATRSIWLLLMVSLLLVNFF